MPEIISILKRITIPSVPRGAVPQSKGSWLATSALHDPPCLFLHSLASPVLLTREALDPPTHTPLVLALRGAPPPVPWS